MARWWETVDKEAVAALHDNDLSQVTWQMRAMGGSPKFPESQTLLDADFAASREGVKTKLQEFVPHREG